ncbi:PEP-CTERM sorting domain-containing protein [Psychromonas sp. SR45-3]|uniref:PEP-CTERM sorting domain-containing protein n=1 Tax=Psychromonas sp. SR45-3 TaxID=2760930 RepID=UPI0015F974D2|nr:PEP-CTERM sorting domain-containing protein [Psychromonas sp. SR45-3]MBB1274922.1 PEP-CTERM sorting domain-containing protein [Psychromonas sp. SR45-3]
MKLINVIASGLMFSASVAYAGAIDLNTWNQSGNSSNGNWNVAADGTSVLQTINGNPTFFISNDSFINNQFTGTFGVETTSDDDFIGFVFGYNGLDDFYLFDWKQSTQVYSGNTGSEGFTLSKISDGANVNSLDALWGHNGNGIDVLGTDYGNDRGWVDNTTYEFTLNYTDTSIDIFINGGTFSDENIFSLAGLNNDSGNFGFFNSSQSQVRYTGFKEEATSVPEPSTLAVFSLAIAGLFWRRKVTNK